jgi:hypothetical protein
MLFRIPEKYIATHWLTKAIGANHIADQLAFRCNGSTTCAPDFSFITSPERQKLMNSFWHRIYTQLAPFLLMNRSHTTKCFDVKSNSLPINQTTVQGLETWQFRQFALLNTEFCPSAH